jgi:Xaa-Pro aminopeptidase
MTEISVGEKLEEFRSQQTNYLGPSFGSLMGYGPHSAFIHYFPTAETNSPLAAQGFLLSDTGGHYLEGSTDVTRTFVLGPLTEEMKRLYTLVLRGNLNLAAAVFKYGCSGRSLDYIARKPLWEQGLDYNHGTGHGVGYLLSIHEGPQSIRFDTTSSRYEETRLEPGMVLSDEPGIYLADRFGIRLENLMYCEERLTNAFGSFLGFHTLTMCPFELDAIQVSKLSAQERELLNAYHQQVYETLSPYLEAEEVAWLKQAPRPV